jgi:hypothetical protein
MWMQPRLYPGGYIGLISQEEERETDSHEWGGGGGWGGGVST